MRPGESADDSVTKPRHTEVGLGVAQEGGEKDFASEFGERDAGLGADTEILLGELSRNFVRQHRRLLGLAQYLQRLDAYFGVGVFKQGQGRGHVSDLAETNAHAVTPDRMDAGEAVRSGLQR